MATISGRIIFDRDRSETFSPGDSGIANVPVVLQDTATNVGLVVLTDINGDYSFTNVPKGDYRLVEAFGTLGGSLTPGNFSTAVVIPFAIGANPPISFATNPPSGSTNLDSVTPDTLLIDVTGEDLTEQNFFNGPVIYTPIKSILDSCVVVSNVNLIDAANDGTFGLFSQGTPANTGAAVEPYPGIAPDFNYVLPNPATFIPDDGEYTVQNIMNNAFSDGLGTWWRIADHTIGNETGRMMVVNGFEPGAVFFRDIVVVQPNTNYLFTAWILNLFKVLGFVNPAIGVRILGQTGDILYSTALGIEIPVNTDVPEWKEIGTVINSGNNTNITVELVNKGTATIGNDYAIDDISLNEVDIPLFVPVEIVSTPVATIGDTVTFTVTLGDTCTSSLTDVFFKDIVPDGLEFLPGSVTVNGSPDPVANPNTGFMLPDISGGNSAIVTFKAIATNIPAINPTQNKATITYSYTPVEGGISTINSVDSNTVLLEEDEDKADISVVKTESPNPVTPGGVITYTLVVSNAGPDDAENVVLTDNISSKILAPQFSTNGGVTFNPWTGSLNLGDLDDGASKTIIIKGTVSATATGCINNTAIVTSSTEDPNLLNNTSSICTDINLQADISVVKTESPDPVAPGGVVTYTIVVSDAGPQGAENVVLVDNIPPEILAPEFSLDGGVTFNPWTGSLNLGTLADGASETILIRGTVSSSATGIITNTVDVISTTPDPNPLNNTSTINTRAVAIADVSVVKTVSPNPVIPGELLTYTLLVSNAGPDPADIVLNDSISAELLAPEFSLDGGVTFNPWPGTFDLGVFAVGASETVLIRGTVSDTATGCVNNAASVTTTALDTNLSNNTSSICTEVELEADISVVKTESPSPVVPGELVTYTIVVSNAGPQEAHNVVVSDNIPPDIIAPEFSTNGGVTFNPWPGFLSLGNLAAGASETILIRGTLSSSATGNITNTVDVISTTPDPNPLNNTFTINTRVPEVLADISVVKTESPNPVTPGGVITYTLVVSNAGPDPADVVLNDSIPADILAPEFSLDGGVTFNPWLGSFDLGILAVGESETVLIRGTVSQAATGCIDNAAIVTSTTLDPNLVNNTSSICTDIELEADISVVKTESPSPVTPGEVLTYTLVVSNAGPQEAQNVVLTDNIPPEISAPEFSTNGGVTFNPWTGSLDLGTLADGASETILIRGTVSSSAIGTITNTANVISITPDPNPLNNTSTVDTEVPEAEADVSVVKTASTNPVSPGEVETYTLVVSNAGPDSAQNVTVSDDVLPSLISPEFSIDGGVTFNPWPGSINIGTLAVGETETILIRGTVSSAVGQIITNTADVVSTTPDPNPVNNTSTVALLVTRAEAEADMSVVKTESPNPVTPGGVITYTLVVSNAGPDPADVVLNDNIPPSILAPEFSTDGGVTFNPWLGSFDLGVLAVGASETILIRGTVSETATGCIDNAAIVTSTTLDPNLVNNTSSICTDVNLEADISVVKTESPSPVVPGELVTYTLVVSNAGPQEAQNVVLTDNIPPDILAPEFSTNGGVTFNPWPGSLDLGTLAVGETESILIRGTVSQAATGTLTNTADVISTTADPNPLNNTSTINTRVPEVLADISVLKTGSPNPVTPGGVITYTLVVSNAGPDPADVVLTDNISPSILAPEFSTDGGVTFNPWPGSFDLGVLAVGETEAVLIRGTVSATATGCINNTAIVTSTTEDPDLLNNTSSLCTEVLAEVPSADVSVVKTASTNPVVPGELETYTLVVTNAGPDPAANVTVNDNVSPSIIAPEFSTDGGVTFNPWPGSLNLGTLAVGETETILIRGTVSEAATGCINNAAIVTSTTLDPNLVNNTSSICVEVTAAVPLADLSVIKTASANPVTPGEVETYTLLVTNAGPNDATNVLVSDNVSPNITAPEFSLDGGVTFNPWPGSINIGTVPAGTSRTILIRGTVSEDATGCINNTAIVTSPTEDPNLLNNTSSICVEVTAAVPLADLSVIKTASVNPVTPGEVETYTLLVTNAGPNDAINVLVSDNVSPNITAPEFSIDGGVTFNPWPGSINIGTVPAGTSRTILIRGTVSDEATGCINNTAIVTSPTEDPNLLNNTSSICVEVTAAVPSADVSVVKMASVNPVTPGEVETYTILVTNAGPDPAANVTLNDNVSPSIIAPEFSTDGGVTFNPWPGSLNLGTLAVGETETILIRGTVSGEATGCINNAAIVTSTTLDPNLVNNTSSICVEVTAAVPLADLSVIKTASANPVTPGGVETYTLLVTNAGPNDATNVIVSDNVSPSIIAPEFSLDGGVTFNPWPGSINIGTLPAGTSRTILIRGTVSEEAIGCINNTAIVTSTTEDPNLLNNTSSICVEVAAAVPSADVSVVKMASVNPVTPGEVETYTILVTNAGPDPATNVTVNDNVSPSIIAPEFSTDGGVTFNPWPGSINIGTLAAGASTTILIRGTVSGEATGCINNTAIVTSTTLDPNLVNNTSSICVEVTAAVPLADLSVIKTASANPVIPGEVETYTLLVTNAGPNDATNVIVSDNVSPSIIAPEFSLDGGVTFNPWPGSINIGTLPAGASTTILIRGTVSQAAIGCINNTAIVTSPTEDPNILNNTSSICVEVTAAVPLADLSVIKTASANPVTPGEVETYTLLVTNAGPNDAENVIVSDNISPSIIAPEFSLDGGVTFNPWPGSINIGTVPAGTSRTILIRGTVSTTATGCINNTAIVTSPTEDPNLLNNTSSICVEVTAAVPLADVSVIKTASANPVVPGEVETYTLVVSNAGPNDAANVIVSDNVSPSIIAPEFSLDGGVTFNPWPGSINIGVLPAGTSRTILIRGTVSPTATGCINNTAIVTSPTEDPNLLNNTSSICVEVTAAVPSADVSVAKTATPNPVTPGGVLTYTLVVSNAGPNDAENVIVNDNVSPNIIGPEFSTDGGVTFNPWPGFLNIGTLPAGASTTILIRGTVSPTATGCINNTAIVTSTTFDPNLVNNTSSICVQVQAVVPEEADVSVVKTSSPNPVTPGGILTYTLVVSNAGPAAAQNVVVNDNIPSSIIGPEFSTDGGVTFNPWPGFFNIGTLPAGASTTILIRGTVSPTATGCINNTAIVTSTTPDPNPLNNISSICTAVEEIVPEEADVSVVKTSSPNPVAPGGILTYTLVVSNAGPAAAQNVVVNDNIPSSIIGPEFSIDGGVTFNPWPGFFNIGTLPAGASETILIRGTVSATATGCITNTAIVTSTTPDPNPINNISSICTAVEEIVPEEADVSVVKTANPNPVSPGGVLTYTIVVSNAGPAAAQNVVLTDSISPSIIGPEFSTDGGVTFNPWPGSFDIGTLPAGASETILITGTVSATATGCITNTAIVTSTTPDPNPLNNVSSICTEVAAPAEADLSVVKKACPNPVVPGEMLTYTIVVSNAGPSAAENVVLVDNVASSITDPEFSLDGGVTFNPWTGSINLGTIPAGGSVTILITGTVNSSAKECIANAASVSSTTPDPNLLNNTSTICVEVREFADVAVKKKCCICSKKLKNIVTFEIRVCNFGPSTARDVILEDRIPNGILDPTFSVDGCRTCEPWTGCLELGDLRAGESITIIIEGILRTPLRKEICNTATVCSKTCDPDLRNNTSSVIIKAKVRINRNRRCESFECFECDDRDECDESRCNECFDRDESFECDEGKSNKCLDSDDSDDCDECREFSRSNKFRENRDRNFIRDDF